jgi:hypothetical protein
MSRETFFKRACIDSMNAYNAGPSLLQFHKKTSEIFVGLRKLGTGL